MTLKEGETKMCTEAIQGHDAGVESSNQVDPLYLFSCRVLWTTTTDEAALWELLSGLASLDPATRVLAGCLLADCV